MADVCLVVGILILIQVTGLQFSRINVALHGQANQSQTLYWNRFNWTADTAVDGCRTTTKADDTKCCSCSLISPYTAGTDNYWRVDFGEAHLIYQIDVYYRQHANQLSGFRVYVKLEEDRELPIAKTTAKNDVYTIPVDPITSATGIIIRRSADIITLCEVEAYECSDGYYGRECLACGNCTSNSTCSKINGYCTHGCSPGWQSQLCNEACDSGTYGDNCTKTCGNCTGNEVCNHINGVCAGGCDDGWQGTTCHDVCSNGYYGAGCNSTCGQCANTGMCHHVNGECGADGCLAGWQGSTCHDACDNGTYGDSCNYTCRNCANNVTCYHVDGGCSEGCTVGWQGHACHDACDHGTYGDDCNSTCGNCTGNAPCNHIDGICTDGCNVGWRGDTCHDECLNYTYGEECKNTCGHCAANGSCDHVSGRCGQGCGAGWRGQLCQSACDHGTYGDDCNSTCGNCARNDPCNHIDGVCADGCTAGWRGDTCHDVCTDSRWGDACNQTCGICHGNATCDHVNGTCHLGCGDGWEGDMCTQVCTDSRWGDACNQTCGNCNSMATCDHVNGACHMGCGDGWEGDLCTQVKASVSENEDGSTTAGVVGGLVAGIVCIVAVLVGVIIWRRRRLRESKACDTEASKPNKNYTDVENMSMDTVTPSTANQLECDESVHEDDEAIYNNMLPDSARRTIPVADLRDYCWRYCTGADQLYADFKDLPYGLQYDTLQANKLHNKKRNRYRDMYAYDKNRVQLPCIPGDPNSDYINASLINGYNPSKQYIASQGAMKSTVDDIWRMVWSQNVYNIVMLTGCMENGATKCIQYWPNEGEANYGAISVTLISEVARSEFTIREFLCQEVDTGSSRQVIQYHYTAWPDKDVPDTPVSLVQFWTKVKHSKHAERTPWLVHCRYTEDKRLKYAKDTLCTRRIDAGVGRTGTFIALDYLHGQATCENQVSVFDCVNILRNQRVNMVQTKTQYVFLHRAVLEAIFPTGKCCPSENFPELYKDLLSIPDGTIVSKLQTEFEIFEQEVTNDMNEHIKPTVVTGEKKPVDNYASSKLPENRIKIRDNAVIPNDRFRPYLTSAVPGCNNFINATVLPGYTAGDKLIITQRPLANTVVDFVRLVWDYNVGTVVVMDRDTQPDTETEYWSGTADTGTFSVTVTHEANRDNFHTRSVRIEHRGVVRECKQLEFMDWPSTGAVPGGTASILEFISHVETVHGGYTDSPIVVCCRNGAARSGLFCVLWVVLQRMKEDREVAIAETIRLMSIRRQQIVPTYAQYKYCHDVIQEYMDTFEVYVNIT